MKQNEYNFVDMLIKNEQQEPVLYCIQNIDKDGQRTYSETKKVKFYITHTSVRIYLNPPQHVWLPFLTKSESCNYNRCYCKNGAGTYV